MRRLEAELLMVEAVVQVLVNRRKEELPRDDVLLEDEPAVVDGEVERNAALLVLREDPCATAGREVGLKTQSRINAKNS